VPPKPSRKKPTAVPPPAKRPEGRPPTTVSTEAIKQIETLAGYGLTIRQIADVIDIPESTLRKRKTDNDRVASAFARGRARAEAVVGRALYLRAIGEIDPKTGKVIRESDIHAIKWWEITRAGRREVRVDELVGKGGKDLPPQHLTVRFVKARARSD
jgi:transcription initiation factor TFIIIB Brf1 subunit/transcription initiation factor TFIIB